MTTANQKLVIQWDIQKVWETVLAVERYPAWRSDVTGTEVTDEKRFVEYAKDGYSTTFTVTAVEPLKRWELDAENSHVKGHWTYTFTSKGSETELDITMGVTAKQLSTRPVGKSVFEKTYLKKELEQFVADLKKLSGC